ncbi:hypothetical protein V8F33_006940 [Rhypophila sp. PSN 637]
MSENLDAIVIWMMFLRQYTGKSGKKQRFHLIVPAYRPMLIKDPLIFPTELYPFTIRGLVHNSRPLVWFDLPTIDNVPAGSFDLQHIGNLFNPPSEWRHAAAGVAGVATAGAGIMTAGALTVATAPAIGLLAGAIWLGGGGASMLAGAKAAERVDRMFERPNPRLIGHRQGGIPERNDFRSQPTTRRVSQNPSRGRRHGQHN